MYNSSIYCFGESFDCLLVCFALFFCFFLNKGTAFILAVYQCKYFDQLGRLQHQSYTPPLIYFFKLQAVDNL